MNKQVNPAETALAMYATACETHMRRDWREACHALAKALKQELESSASLRAMASAVPTPYAKEVTQDSPEGRAIIEVAKAAAKPRAKAAKPGAAHFEMTAGSLTTALRMLAKVSPARSTQPILHMVHMQAAGDVLTLTCTDLDKSLSIDVSDPGIGTWQACVNVRDLLAIVAKAGKSEWVSFRYDDAPAGVRVIIGAVQHALAGRAPDDFPSLDTGELYPLCLDGAEILEALRFVSPAISTEETRFYLNGVYLSRPTVNGAHRLHVVATDGHRLHRWQGEPLDGKPATLAADTKAPAMIVPREAVAVILAMGGDGAGLTLDGNHKAISATRGPVRLVAKCIDGSFPDYMRVIPNAHAFTMTADRADLAGAVANVATICDTKESPVRWTLAHAAGALSLEAKNADGGKAAAALQVKASAKAWGKAHGKKGEAEPDAPTVINWAFRAAYVRDAMASLTGPTVTLAGMDSASPYTVTNPADERRLVVLMPLRV